MNNRRMLSTMLLVLALLCPSSGKLSDEALVLAAANELRDIFNRSGCRAFIQQVDQSERKMPEVQRAWMNGCERMQDELGTWTVFDHVSSELLAKGAIPSFLAEGRAVFANGDDQATFWVQSYWHVSNSRAELYWLALEGGGRRFALPRPLPARWHITPGNGVPA